MKCKYDVVLGASKITLEFDASNNIDFFEQLAFYSTLPKQGPGGESDLTIQVRTTKKGKYYSIVCESAKQEYMFGIYNNESRNLFPKGWQPLYEANQNTSGGGTSQQAPPFAQNNQQQAAPQGTPQPAFVPPNQNQAPPQQQATGAAPAFVPPTGGLAPATPPSPETNNTTASPGVSADAQAIFDKFSN